MKMYHGRIFIDIKNDTNEESEKMKQYVQKSASTCQICSCKALLCHFSPVRSIIEHLEPSHALEDTFVNKTDDTVKSLVSHHTS